MNPHIKEDWFAYKFDTQRNIGDRWQETGMEVEVGGLGLIICTVCVSGMNSVNIGFRILDENGDPLPPYRTNTGNRHPAHFSFEPQFNSYENMEIITFHIIANCRRAKLQFQPSDGISSVYEGIARINLFPTTKNVAWCHKPISTMAAIPLMPIYQPGANTIFTYPKSRMPRMAEDDKKMSTSIKEIT